MLKPSPLPNLQMFFAWLDTDNGHSQKVFSPFFARNSIQIAGREKRNSSSASTGAVPAAQKGEGVVAIDSKIEQAMDLVKTHLIYAVRDEMELLRARIVHLEATVVQLETENAILRQHIPREVLDRLSKQQKTPHLLHNASVAAIAQ